MWKFIRWFLRVDWAKTVIFNFRKFDFLTALKLPVLIGRHSEKNRHYP